MWVQFFITWKMNGNQTQVSSWTGWQPSKLSFLFFNGDGLSTGFKDITNYLRVLASSHRKHRLTRFSSFSVNSSRLWMPIAIWSFSGSDPSCHWEQAAISMPCNSFMHPTWWLLSVFLLLSSCFLLPTISSVTNLSCWSLLVVAPLVLLAWAVTSGNSGLCWEQFFMYQLGILYWGYKSQ